MHGDPSSTSDTAGTTTEQFLTFRIADEAYGLDILRVREIRGWSAPREMPNMPRFIKGVVDFRGGIVPIIDLRERFALGKADYDRETVVVMLSVRAPHDPEGSSETIMGIVVDRVADVLDARTDEIKPQPRLGSKLDTRYLRGVVKRENDMVLLVDIDHLLDPETFGQVEELARND